MKLQELIPTLEWTRQLLDWDNASSNARSWWKELEQINHNRVDLVIKLADELLLRDASIEHFFLACSYSNREGVRENLKFLDTISQDRRSIRMEEEQSSGSESPLH